MKKSFFLIIYFLFIFCETVRYYPVDNSDTEIYTYTQEAKEQKEKNFEEEK